ncbi:mannitol-1-phosphate 5-dehydrogenase [Paenibacillus algorifonticola]|uniref:mannitol-1-phosphate 5-dehydrogenase n=1 Tax=Paenibacillus algorifonticola TaxID=684063 RepID=UPI003D2A31D2
MRAVHFGAGNIGRGFIGLLLSQAGCSVTFVDVNASLVALLQEKQQYTVKLASEQAESFTVSGVNAINGNDTALVAAAIAEADLVTTAVGVSVLKHIAGAIAEGITLRLAKSQAAAASPLPVIACENAIGGSTQLRELVYSHLAADVKAQAEQAIAFPDAAVDRIVPQQLHDDPLQVTVEPFYEWTVDRSALPQGTPEIPGIHYVDQLQPYIERKLFTVNTGHCVAAYHGYLQGYATIQEAMQDAAVRREVEGALKETGAMLVRTYSFSESEHQAYIEQILERFINPYLTDEVVRVGRSPIRKLSPDDRLVRPALLAFELGLPTAHLTKAMAAALRFTYTEDSEAAEIQAALTSSTLSDVIARYTSLPAEHPLHAQIVAAYSKL